MIYYLMGKSSSGKDTIYKRLRELRPEWREVVPYTTRPIRDGETQGVEYHFISNEVMDELIRGERVIELRSYDTIYGCWRYGTVNDGQIKGNGRDGDYLMIGTLEGYDGMRRYFGEGSLYPIYIEVPEALRLERARAREMKQRSPRLLEMQRRFEADERDFSEEKLMLSGIKKRYKNVELESCIDEIIKDTGA